MITLKQFFGFFLLASAVWLLWVWQKLAPDTAVENILLASILLAFAAWAWEKSKQGHKLWRWRALILLAAGCIFILLKPTLNQSHVNGNYGGLPSAKYSRQAVAAAQNEGRIIYLDFTAAWCLSCQVNKKIVFSSEAVRREFAQKNVLILVADWTNRDPEITAALAAYRRVGVPLNIFLGPTTEKEPEVLPALLSASAVRRALANRN